MSTALHCTVLYEQQRSTAKANKLSYKVKSKKAGGLELRVHLNNMKSSVLW